MSPWRGSHGRGPYPWCASCLTKGWISLRSNHARPLRLFGRSRCDRHISQNHSEPFVEYVADRAGMDGLWIFDEAESALSFNGCLMLLSHIKDLLAHGSQVIISTHSPILASLPEAAGDCSSMPRRDTGGTSVLRGLLSAYA